MFKMNLLCKSCLRMRKKFCVLLGRTKKILVNFRLWVLGYSEYFFKEVDKILNPSDANFKGSDNKNLGCLNLSFHP